MAEKKLPYTHGFKVHVPNLLEEITKAALPRKELGALRIPLSIFNKYLLSVAIRASQLNDPILNKLMVEMALYEVGNPESEDYDPEIVKQVFEKAENFNKSLTG